MVVSRRVGRPRQVSDEAIFGATLRVIAEVGYARFTLAQVASELKVTTAAVRQRFGSKRNLLVAYYTWLNRVSAERFERLRATYSQPLDALWHIIIEPLPAFPKPGNMAHTLSTYIDVIEDAELKQLVHERFALLEGHITALLAQAVAAGETAMTDVPEGAHVLFAAIQGAMLDWSVRGEGRLADQFYSVFTRIVQPRIAPPRP